MEVSNVTLHQHFKLYKPYGFLSQFESNARHQSNSKFLGDLYPFPKGTMAIGRLDKDSEGLLLLTTDGQLSSDINSNTIEKEYYAQVDGRITHEAIHCLQKGIDLNKESQSYTSKPCIVSKLNSVPLLPERGKKIRDNRHGETSWISIIITEGKFRQVRKMTSAVGFPTLRLVRVRVGTILLEDMQPSEVVEVERLL